MNNRPIRAFEALTVGELELLAVIGSLHDSAGKPGFYLDKFVRRRLATARRLEASAAPADAEEARRLRRAAEVSVPEVGYIASCCHDEGEDPSVMHARIRRLPLRFAFAVAELATAELERAWADAHASDRPLSEVIRPFVRIRDDDFTLEAEELAHMLINAWGEGRPFSEVVEQFSPARGAQRGRWIGSITRVKRLEPTTIPDGLGSTAGACPG